MVEVSTRSLPDIGACNSLPRMPLLTTVHGRDSGSCIIIVSGSHKHFDEFCFHYLLRKILLTIIITMASFSVHDVLMRLDEDSDDDFDGYLDEESYSRGSESDGGDDDNGGNVDI